MLTFRNLYAEEFSLDKIAINLSWQLVGTEMKKASWGGNLVFEDPVERKLRGESKFSPTDRGNKPL